MQDALADAFQIAVGAAQVIQIARHRVLDILVLAAAALEDQFDLDLVLLPLLEVNDRRLFAQVVAAVLAAEGIHRIGAQLACPRGLRNGAVDRLLNSDLVHAHRRVHHERRHPGVLANRSLILHRHIDVGQDDVEGLRGLRRRRLLVGRQRHRGAHIGRKVGGCLGNQFQQAGGKEFHNRPLNAIVSQWPAYSSFNRTSACMPGLIAGSVLSNSTVTWLSLISRTTPAIAAFCRSSTRTSAGCPGTIRFSISAFGSRATSMAYRSVAIWNNSSPGSPALPPTSPFRLTT